MSAQTRRALAKPFDLVAASLDERKDDEVSGGVLEMLFGHYRFDDDQLKVSAVSAQGTVPCRNCCSPECAFGPERLLHSMTVTGRDLDPLPDLLTYIVAYT